jgi:hypothetical protein
MSPEVRAALDALEPEDRERIEALLCSRRQQPRQGDSSAGIPSDVDEWPEEYQTRSTSDWR